MTSETLRAARDLAGYDQVSRLRQAQDHDWLLSLVDRPPHRVADLGCGTGALLGTVVRRWPGIRRALGVDGSPARIREAAGHLGGLPEVELAHGDLLRLPPAGTRFDLVTMTSVLHWLYPREERALSWVADHLVPGGALLLTTHHPDLDEQGHGGEDPVVREALEHLGVDPGALARTVPMGVRARPVDAARHLLERHLRVETYQERRVPMVASGAEEYRRFHLATFGTYFSRLVPDDRQEEFFDAVGTVAARRMAAHGRVYDLTVRAWRAVPHTR